MLPGRFPDRRFGALALALVSTLPAHAAPAPAAQQTAWTVEQIFGSASEHGTPAPSDTSWSPDGSRYTYISGTEGLVSIDAATGKRSTLLPAAKLALASRREVNEKDKDHRSRYSQPGYIWSPDAAQLLFDEDGTLWLDTLKNGSFLQIGDTEQGSGDDVKFSPDGKTISYLREHNLYVVQPGQQPVALTRTGSPSVLDGEVDWVYLEELKARTNYAWAPDSSHLAYIQMDERAVPTYPLADWIPTHTTLDMQRYPEPGDPNPVVRLGVVPATGGDTQWITLPLHPGDDYIPRLGWVDAHTVWAETLTRDHQHRSLYFADIANGQSRRVYDEQDAKFFNDSYDLSFYTPPQPGLGAFLLTSWRDGHTHLYRYSYDATHPLAAEARLEGQLERGDYEVGDILSVDAGAGLAYYASTESVSGPPGTMPRQNSATNPGALQQQLWAVGLDGTGKRALTTTPGSHKAAFAQGRGSYTDMASSATTPPSLSLCRVGGELPPNLAGRC